MALQSPGHAFDSVRGTGMSLTFSIVKRWSIMQTRWSILLSIVTRWSMTNVKKSVENGSMASPFM